MLWMDGPSEARRNDKRGSRLARSSARRRRAFSYQRKEHEYGESPHARGTVEGAGDRAAGGDPGVRAGGGADLSGEDRQVPLPGAAPGTGSAAPGALTTDAYALLRAGVLRREPPELPFDFEAAFG